MSQEHGPLHAPPALTPPPSCASPRRLSGHSARGRTPSKARRLIAPSSRRSPRPCSGGFHKPAGHLFNTKTPFIKKTERQKEACEETIVFCCAMGPSFIYYICVYNFHICRHIHTYPYAYVCIYTFVCRYIYIYIFMYVMCISLKCCVVDECLVWLSSSSLGGSRKVQPSRFRAPCGPPGQKVHL